LFWGQFDSFRNIEPMKRLHRIAGLFSNGINITVLLISVLFEKFARQGFVDLTVSEGNGPKLFRCDMVAADINSKMPDIGVEQAEQRVWRRCRFC